MCQKPIELEMYNAIIKRCFSFHRLLLLLLFGFVWNVVYKQIPNASKSMPKLLRYFYHSALKITHILTLYLTAYTNHLPIINKVHIQRIFFHQRILFFLCVFSISLPSRERFVFTIGTIVVVAVYFVGISQTDINSNILLKSPKNKNSTQKTLFLSLSLSVSASNINCSFIIQLFHAYFGEWFVHIWNVQRAKTEPYCVRQINNTRYTVYNGYKSLWVIETQRERESVVRRETFSLMPSQLSTTFTDCQQSVVQADTKNPINAFK